MWVGNGKRYLIQYSARLALLFDWSRFIYLVRAGKKANMPFKSSSDSEWECVRKNLFTQRKTSVMHPSEWLTKPWNASNRATWACVTPHRGKKILWRSSIWSPIIKCNFRRNCLVNPIFEQSSNWNNWNWYTPHSAGCRQWRRYKISLTKCQNSN